MVVKIIIVFNEFRKYFVFFRVSKLAFNFFLLGSKVLYFGVIKIMFVVVEYIIKVIIKVWSMDIKVWRIGWCV